MTDAGDEPDDDGRDAADLDELRPPSSTTDPVQDPVELPEAIVDSGEPGEELQDPLDVPRPPSRSTDPVQDPVEPEWRESADSMSGEKEPEPDPDVGAGEGRDGV